MTINYIRQGQALPWAKSSAVIFLKWYRFQPICLSFISKTPKLTSFSLHSAIYYLQMAKRANSNTNSTKMYWDPVTEYPLMCQAACLGEVVKITNSGKQKPAFESWPHYNDDYDHLMRDDQERDLHPNEIIWKQQGKKKIILSNCSTKRQSHFSKVTKIQTEPLEPMTLITTLSGYHLSSMKSSLWSTYHSA